MNREQYLDKEDFKNWELSVELRNEEVRVSTVSSNENLTYYNKGYDTTLLFDRLGKNNFANDALKLVEELIK